MVSIGELESLCVIIALIDKLLEFPIHLGPICACCVQYFMPLLLDFFLLPAEFLQLLDFLKMFEVVEMLIDHRFDSLTLDFDRSLDDIIDHF